MHNVFKNLFLRIVWGLFITWTLSVSGLFAQLQNEPNKRELAIGELTGRVDKKDWKIQTKLGLLPVFGSGNGRPFRAFERSPNEVVIRFLNSEEFEIFNPNTVIFRFYETERALISALILDEIDTAVLESEVSALEVKKSNNHFSPVPVRADSNMVKLIFYNHRNPALRSRQVRKALSFAINHDRIIKKIIFNGKATLSKGPFDDDSPLFNQGMESYKYNPKRAVQLLQEAGWRDSDKDGILDRAGQPLTLNFYYSKGLRLDESISRQIKIDLLKVGVEVNPRPLVKSKLIDNLVSGNFDAILTDYTFESGIESLERVFSVKGVGNYIGYTSKIFEDRLNFYHNTDDLAMKKTLIQSLQEIINQDQPATFLYFKWWTHYLVNLEKLRNYRDLQGDIRPFEEWIIRDLESN
ncbi:hypothetical protein IIA28_04760 [candidate division KSB1 bacterium]|nr:hypothetical protein [candidate division KSB1 bacterium]